MVINTVTQGTTSSTSASGAVLPSTSSTAQQAGGQNLPVDGQSVPSAAASTGQNSHLADAIDKLSQHVQNVQRDLEFSVDKDSGETVVKIIDSSTDKVIRQIPSEEILAMARSLTQLSGILFHTKA